MANGSMAAEQGHSAVCGHLRRSHEPESSVPCSALWRGSPARWPAGERPSEKVSFNRDIRPIMSDTCFHCHGNDAGTREAGLRLDVRGGGPGRDRRGRGADRAGRSRLERDHPADFRRRRSDAAGVGPQAALAGAEGAVPPLGRRGRRLRAALGLRTARAARPAAGQRGQEPDRCVRRGPARRRAGLEPAAEAPPAGARAAACRSI